MFLAIEYFLDRTGHRYLHLRLVLMLLNVLYFLYGGVQAGYLKKDVLGLHCLLPWLRLWGVYLGYCNRYGYGVG